MPATLAHEPAMPPPFPPSEDDPDEPRRPWTAREAEAYLARVEEARAEEERGLLTHGRARYGRRVTDPMFEAWSKRIVFAISLYALLQIAWKGAQAMGLDFAGDTSKVEALRAELKVANERIELLVRADSARVARDRERLSLIEVLVKATCLTMPRADQIKLGLPCDEVLSRPTRPIHWQSAPPPAIRPDQLAAAQASFMRALLTAAPD